MPGRTWSPGRSAGRSGCRHARRAPGSRASRTGRRTEVRRRHRHCSSGTSRSCRQRRHSGRPRAPGTLAPRLSGGAGGQPTDARRVHDDLAFLVQGRGEHCKQSRIARGERQRTICRKSRWLCTLHPMTLPAHGRRVPSLLLLAACAGAPAPGAAPPVAPPGTRGAAAGARRERPPRDPRRCTPARADLLESRDSTFLFGSVGDGQATLTLDERPVRVWPNGAWLAWVPVPPESVPTYLPGGPDRDRLRPTGASHPPGAALPPSGGSGLDRQHQLRSGRSRLVAGGRVSAAQPAGGGGGRGPPAAARRHVGSTGAGRRTR